jgi:hypothetical protein
VNELLSILRQKEVLESLYRAHDKYYSANGNESYVIEANEGALKHFHVTVISSNDPQKDSRNQYIATIFNAEITAHFDMNLGTIPKTYNPIDILIVSSSDSERVARFMKMNLPLCRNIPKISVSDGLHPRKRAKLLNSGLDDVFDTKNSRPKEAELRILSIYNRYKSLRRNSEFRSVFFKLLSEICDYEILSPPQMRILLKLISNKGQPCSNYSLQIAGATGSEPISLEHLRVLIHYIRSTLDDNYDIENTYGRGYHLKAKSIY